VANPEDVLNPSDYRNYRNIRAVSVLFIVFGSILALGLVIAITGQPPESRRPGEEELPRWAAALGGIVGLFGAVGGIAARRGNRRLAPLIYVMAFFYLFAIPLGTIMSYVMFKGLPRYLDSVQQLRTSTQS
jgi:hypothetical protein